MNLIHTYTNKRQEQHMYPSVTILFSAACQDKIYCMQRVEKISGKRYKDFLDC